MTYQRAVVNCRRCYELANISCMQGDLARLQNDQLWTARNEAMESLGNEIDSFSRIDTAKANMKFLLALRALDICMNCEYKEPSIANFYSNLTEEHHKRALQT